MARVLLGVTGGIAAYKACELCRLLVRAGHEVTPVLTPDAERFVATHTFEALARREAPRDLYPHLVDADLLVIAAAKRARQINNYHHQLGEGTFDDFPPPLVESRSKNYLTMALEEIGEGKIKVSQPG